MKVTNETKMQKKKEEKKEKLQDCFERDVKKMKIEADELKLPSTSKYWNYGLDPQKSNSKLGKRKSLPRLCSSFIRQHISQWIPTDCTLNYCVMSKGKNACCDHFNLQQYTFPEALTMNISSMIQEKFDLCKVNQPRMVTRAVMREIIDEKTTNCKLKIFVNNEYERVFYLKRIKQDRLAKSMDIAQNDYRMSYAPEILIAISDGIVMRLRCKSSWIGVGFWDLVKWKSNRNTNTNSSCINPFEETYVHSMIHIYDSFDIMSKIDIAFGVTTNANIDSVCIEIIGAHLIECKGKIVLYIWKKQQVNDSNDSRYQMPIIGNLSDSNNNNKNKNTNNNDSNITQPPTKKRKLN